MTLKPLFKKLCDAFGPSSLEDEVREIILNEITPHAASVKIDKIGNIIAFKKGKSARRKKLLFSSHMDEVGFMIRHVDDDGYAYFGTVGGINESVIPGKKVVIGENRIPGVISAKAIHLQTPDERGVSPSVEKLYIDIGAKSKADTLTRLEVGDMATFAPDFEYFGSDRVKSKAIDDRFGCYALCELIKKDLPYDTFFAFTVQEEEGCRGAAAVAFGEAPDEVVIVESTTAADIQGVPEHQRACVLGQGSVISFMDNSTLYPRSAIENIKTLCNENNIKWQLKTLVAGGNEARVYQTSQNPAVVAAVSAPVRYIHSPACIADISDLAEVEKLLLKLAESGLVS